MSVNFAGIVDIGGGLAHSTDNAVTCIRQALGVYRLTFPDSVDGSARLATLGAVDSTAQVAGSITTELGPMGNSKVVVVRTFNTAANAVGPDDRPFQILLRSAD